MRAQSLDIPLNLSYLGTNNQAAYLTINVGIGGAAPRPYLFDTGSSIFLAGYTTAAFGSVPEYISPSVSGYALNQQESYCCTTGGGGSYGYYYDVTSAPSLTFYPSYTSTAGGVTLNAITPSGASSGFLMGAITGVFGGFTVPEGTLPGIFPGDYGNFAAGNFLKGEPGSVLGQSVVPGTTAGYVIAANGQPLSAINAGPYQQYLSSPNGPQVSQSVTSCSPCVMLGLTPALIAQFKPTNLIPTITFGHFANSGAPSTNQEPFFLPITVTTPGGSTTTVMSRSLLDSGTNWYFLSNQIAPSAYANGGTLTISGNQSGATPSTVTLLNNSSAAAYYGNPYNGQPSSSVESTIGLGFFLTNSVLYDLAGQAVGYTPNFVTDVNIATTQGAPLVIDSGSVPLGLAGVISGSGQLEVVNGGSATLSGTDTYTGATIVNNAFLALAGPGSISASSGVSVSNFGVFDVSGVGSGTPSGVSITSLSSTDNAGTVLLGSNALVLTNANGSFGGTITDGGSYGGSGGALVLAGGVETLSGVNSYTGGTYVNGGTLNVAGSIAAATVNAGGVLMGTGTVGPTWVNAGGALAPGNGTAGSMLTIAGNLAFQSGALYVAQLRLQAASSANVAGTASLAGTALAALTSGSYNKETVYDILHTRGLNGTTFSGAAASAPGFTAGLTYSATDVFLTLSATLGLGGGLNGNQRNVANAMNNFFNLGGTLSPGFFNLFQLSGPALSNALTQVSGETATGSQQATFGAMGQFMGIMTDPFIGRGGGINGSNAALGYAIASNPTDAFAMFTKAPPAAFEPRWNVWASAFGGSQSTEGNAAAATNNATSSIYGTAVGADYLLSPNALVGFAMAGGGTNFAVVNGGTGRSDLFQFGAYARRDQGPAYITGALAYGWQDITTTRTVTVSGLDQLRAQFDANAWSGRVEGGYRFVSPATSGIGITPYAAAQFVTFDLPAYAEQAIAGSNNFALSYGAHDATDVHSELGVRADKSWLLRNGVLMLRGRLAWAHDYDPDRSIAATFQSLPGTSFVVNGAVQAADSALTTASIEMKWKCGWSAAATFEGEFSNVTSSYAGKGVVRYQW